MKFRLKITLCMLCLLSLLFGMGGSALLSISFKASLQHEQQAVRESYQLLLNTLQVVNRAKAWGGAGDVSRVLAQLLSENASAWSALRVFSAGGTVYENGTANLLPATPDESVPPQACQVSGLAGADGQQYLCLAGAFAMGQNTLYLYALRNITAIYTTQAQQMHSYRGIYLCMVLACAVLTYSISWLLTRPLVRLSKASQEIAGGNLSYRSAITSGDEVGALSADFDHMAGQLQHNIEALKDAMARQERFTQNFTHELKTPMAAIIGNADLLRMQALTPAEQAEAANFIFEAAKRLENLSIRLLDIFVAEGHTPQLRPTSIAALAEKLAASARLPAGVTLDVCCEAGSCLAEPDLVWSLLSNLLDNAQKAVGPHGHIQITSHMTPQGCCICVRDDGCGIPQPALAHLTEAFYRVDHARSGQSGAGLGLALCAKIAELHGGSMVFDSQVGRGTSVTVQLKEGRA